MTRATQYVVTLDGEPMLTLGASEDKQTALDYIARAVACGSDRSRYGIAHRTVTYGEWAPTTGPREPQCTCAAIYLLSNVHTSGCELAR